MSDKQIVVSMSVLGIIALIVGIFIVMRPATPITEGITPSPPAVVNASAVISTQPPTAPAVVTPENAPAVVVQPIVKPVQPVVTVTPQPVVPKPAPPVVLAPPRAFRGIDWGGSFRFSE